MPIQGRLLFNIPLQKKIFYIFDINLHLKISNKLFFKHKKKLNFVVFSIVNVAITHTIQNNKPTVTGFDCILKYSYYLNTRY